MSHYDSDGILQIGVGKAKNKRPKPAYENEVTHSD